MDSRLVIQKALGLAIQRTLHYGHVGRSDLFRKTSEFWWMFTHWDAMTVRYSKDYQAAVKNFQSILHRIHFGKLPTSREFEEEI